VNTDSNSAAPIRAGEELPVDRLSAFLQQHIPVADGTLTVEQFPHGHSNLTYLVRWGNREWVLRRPPFGNVVATAHDMSREFRILSRLNVVYPPAPRPELYCEDESVIGAPFYLMERRRGVILRKSLPGGITIDVELARQMSTALIDNLAALHAVDYRAAGLDELGKPEGYVQRQVAGWTKRYAQAQTSQVPAMDRVAAWLGANQPGESRAAVIHNDYKYDNVMLAADNMTRIVAVLDWEMATLGDPLMDLGATLAYWVEPTDPAPLRHAAFGPTALPGSLTRREVIERYQSQTGSEVNNVEFYYCFGLFKLAVIVQQIYARFVRGNTSDARFAHLDQLVVILSEQAERTINADMG
jgi:aminoglycoside phosphotransferase (APT) family kinase protein